MSAYPQNVNRDDFEVALQELDLDTARAIIRGVENVLGDAYLEGLPGLGENGTVERARRLEFQVIECAKSLVGEFFSLMTKTFNELTDPPYNPFNARLEQIARFRQSIKTSRNGWSVQQ
jgi:hypothetical protein